MMISPTSQLGPNCRVVPVAPNQISPVLPLAYSTSMISPVVLIAQGTVVSAVDWAIQSSPFTAALFNPPLARMPKLAGFPADRSMNRLSVLTRSEEHTSELQSLMRISYAVFCLKKKKNNRQQKTKIIQW